MNRMTMRDRGIDAVALPSGSNSRSLSRRPIPSVSPRLFVGLIGRDAFPAAG
jgi:hypothetical protein